MAAVTRGWLERAFNFLMNLAWRLSCCWLVGGSIGWRSSTTLRVSPIYSLCRFERLYGRRFNFVGCLDVRFSFPLCDVFHSYVLSSFESFIQPGR